MKKLNCNPGNYRCGNICISKNKKCRGDEIGKAGSDLINTHVSLIESLGTEAKKYYDSSTIWPKLADFFGGDEYKAWGLQSYFSVDYKNINRTFYDSTFKPTNEIKIKAEALSEAFDSLPEINKDEIISHYDEKGIKYDGSTVYRGIGNEDPEFFNKFIQSHKENDIIEYPGFTSTSVANPKDSLDRKVDGSWGSKPAQVIIKQKDSTAGKWVDPYKLSKDEGEILYPPGQRFKVEKIEKDEREKLPPRLRDPLLNLFKSKDDGFGIENLSLKDVLGDLSPAEIMTNPELLWIKSLFKKRGSLDITAIDPNTKLKEILTLSSHKGGKSKFYDLASQSLLNTSNISLDEKTNEREIFGAKIYLEEI